VKASPRISRTKSALSVSVNAGTDQVPEQVVAAESEIGLATGLAWTEVGGEVLQIEATLTKGRGTVTLTWQTSRRYSRSK